MLYIIYLHEFIRKNLKYNKSHIINFFKFNKFGTKTKKRKTSI